VQEEKKEKITDHQQSPGTYADREGDACNKQDDVVNLFLILTEEKSLGKENRRNISQGEGDIFQVILRMTKESGGEGEQQNN